MQSGLGSITIGGKGLTWFQSLAICAICVWICYSGPWNRQQSVYSIVMGDHPTQSLLNMIEQTQLKREFLGCSFSWGEPPKIHHCFPREIGPFSTARFMDLLDHRIATLPSLQQDAVKSSRHLTKSWSNLARNGLNFQVFHGRWVNDLSMDLHDFPQVRVGEPFSRKPSTLPGPLKMDLEEDFPMKDMAIAFHLDFKQVSPVHLLGFSADKHLGGFALAPGRVVWCTLPATFRVSKGKGGPKRGKKKWW